MSDRIIFIISICFFGFIIESKFKKLQEVLGLQQLYVEKCYENFSDSPFRLEVGGRPRIVNFNLTEHEILIYDISRH